MRRRTIIITGASDGIGAAAARRLSRNGANVVLIGRSEAKTTALAAELGADYFVADFADLSQVRALADKIRSEYPRIDVLANNAGGMAATRALTADGYERTYQVNYLAPFLLTTQLMDVLLESGTAVLNTTSNSQKLLPRVRIADLEHTERHRPTVAYAYTKLAMILFTRELHRRYHADGLSAVTFHPGYVNSNFGHASGAQMFVFMEKYLTITNRWTVEVDEGSDQLVWLASSTPGTDWQPGEYYARHRISRAHRAAYDPVLASQLWERSLAKLTV